MRRQIRDGWVWVPKEPLVIDSMRINQADGVSPSEVTVRLELTMVAVYRAHGMKVAKRKR